MVSAASPAARGLSVESPSHWLPKNRRRLFDVPLWAVTFDEAVAAVLSATSERRQGYVALANAYTMMMATSDAEYAAVYEQASLVLPDGMPLIWALNSLRGADRHLKERVFGPGVMLAVLERGRALGLRHFFYGGKDGSSQVMLDKLSQRYPGIIAAGSYEPPFRPLSPAEEAEVLAKITAAAPHVVWVGIGAPKQEIWMRRHAASLPCPAVGVGAAFDFHSGRVRRAPAWMGQAGLEWAFRLAMEPRRLWRRYLWGNSRFLTLWFRALVSAMFR